MVNKFRKFLESANSSSLFTVTNRVILSAGHSTFKEGIACPIVQSLRCAAGVLFRCTGRERVAFLRAVDRPLDVLFPPR